MVETADTTQPRPNNGIPAATLEGGFHEGLATSAYFRRALDEHVNAHARHAQYTSLLFLGPPEDVAYSEEFATMLGRGPSAALGGERSARVVGANLRTPTF